MPALDTNTDPTPALSALPDIDPAEQLAQAHTLLAEREAAITQLQEKMEAQRAHLADLESNTFSFALLNLDAGSVLEELGAELETLTRTVEARQEKGSLTFTLNVKPFKPGSLVLTAGVKCKLPTKEAPHSLFFANEDGGLSRQDPRQKELPFGA